MYNVFANICVAAAAEIGGIFLTLASLLFDFLLFSDLCGLQDVQPHSAEVIIHSFFYAALSCGQAFTHERARLFRVTALAGCEFKQSMFLTLIRIFVSFLEKKAKFTFPSTLSFALCIRG